MGKQVPQQGLVVLERIAFVVGIKRALIPARAKIDAVLVIGMVSKLFPGIPVPTVVMQVVVTLEFIIIPYSSQRG